MRPPATSNMPGQSVSSQSGFAHSFNHATAYPPPNPSHELKWRQPGKSKQPKNAT